MFIIVDFYYFRRIMGVRKRWGHPFCGIRNTQIAVNTKALESIFRHFKFYLHDYAFLCVYITYDVIRTFIMAKNDVVHLNLKSSGKSFSERTSEFTKKQNQTRIDIEKRLEDKEMRQLEKEYLYSDYELG